MAIYRLLQHSTMGPKELSCITAAYEQALHTLCVKAGDDPLTEMIAKTIIRIGIIHRSRPFSRATSARGCEPCASS